MKIKKKPIKTGKIKRILSRDIDGVFNDFGSGLENTKFKLDIFYKNIKGVKIAEVTPKEMLTHSSVAEYNIRYNIIRYIKNSFKIGIMHELFHLASTIVGKNIIYSGFFQQNIQTKEFIGYGLNEAYTAILDDRYFKDYTKDKEEIVGNSYQVTKYLVTQIESCIGQEVMEELYSTCDLYTLTTILADTMGLKETLKFYRALDYIMLNLESGRHCNAKIVLKNYEYASLYTAKLFLAVIQHAYIDEELTDDQYEDFLLDLQEQLGKPMIIGRYFKKSSKIVEKEDFDKMVVESMKKCLKKYT